MTKGQCKPVNDSELKKIILMRAYELARRSFSSVSQQTTLAVFWWKPCVSFEDTFHPTSFLLPAVFKTHTKPKPTWTNKLHIQTNISICCNSSHSERRRDHGLSPSCQSQSSPKLFMALYFIYDYIFPCRLKVCRSRFCWQKQSSRSIS